MGKGIATAAAWAAPAFAIWAIGAPVIGWAFILSFLATLGIWANEGKAG